MKHPDDHMIDETERRVVNEPYALAEEDVIRYIDEKMTVKQLAYLLGQKLVERNPDTDSISFQEYFNPLAGPRRKITVEVTS